MRLTKERIITIYEIKVTKKNEYEIKTYLCNVSEYI